MDLPFHYGTNMVSCRLTASLSHTFPKTKRVLSKRIDSPHHTTPHNMLRMAKSKASVPTTMPLTVVKPEDITEFDVRVRKRYGANPAGGKNSVGNLRYRTILKAAVSQFKQEKSSNEKSIIAQHVLKDLEPGRMLQFQAHDGSFHHIGDEASLKKVHKDFYNLSANMMVLKRGNAAAGSGKKKKDGQGAKHKLCRSAPPRGVTKSAEEAPIRNEDSLAPNTIALTGGEDDASSGDPYSTKVEAELEATARRLETENSTLLRERIEALTAKNQKLRRLEKKNVNLLRERIEDLTAKNQKLRNEKYSRSPLSSLPENGV